MSYYLKVQKMPTVLTREMIAEYMHGDCKGIHESVLRSFNILGTVKDLLRRDAAPDVILKIIEVMEFSPASPESVTK